MSHWSLVPVCALRLCERCVCASPMSRTALSNVRVRLMPVGGLGRCELCVCVSLTREPRVC